MDVFTVVFVVAVLVEAIVQVVKTWVPEGVTLSGWVWPVVSAVIGVLLCLLAKVNVFDLLGVDLSIPAVSEVLTGVLVSRGAGFVHDLWGKVKGE